MTDINYNMDLHFFSYSLERISTIAIDSGPVCCISRTWTHKNSIKISNPDLRAVVTSMIYEYNNTEGSYTTLKRAEIKQKYIKQKYNNIHETYEANNRNKVMGSRPNNME